MYGYGYGYGYPRAAKVGSSAPLALDDLDNIYGVNGVIRMLRSFPLSEFAVEVIRDSDSDQEGFRFIKFGSLYVLDKDEISAWAGGANIFVINVFDQSQQNRPALQETSARRPKINLSGNFPTIEFDKASQHRLSVPAAVGFVNAAVTHSVLAVAKHDSLTGGAAQHVLSFNADTGSAARIAMNTDAALGLMSCSIRSIDGESPVRPAGVAEDTEWHVRFSRTDYVENITYSRVDDTESNATGFTAASTDPQDAASVVIGNSPGFTTPFDGQMMGWAFIRDFVTDQEEDIVVSRLSGFFPLSDPQEFIADAMIGTMDGAALSHESRTTLGIVRRSGLQALVEVDEESGHVARTFHLSDRYSGPNDHKNPCVLVSQAGKLMTAYTGHAESADVHYRIGTSGRISSLAPEQVFQAPGNTTYPQLFEHLATGDIYLLVRRSIGSDDDAWGLAKMAAEEIEFTWVGEIVAADEQVYCQTGGIVGDLMTVFCRFNAGSGSDGLLRVATVDVVTGDVRSAVGVIGNYIEDDPADIADMTVLFDPEADGVGVNTVHPLNRQLTFEVRDGSQSTYHYGQLADDGDPLDPADWTITPITGAGALTGSNYSGRTAIAHEASSNPRVRLGRMSGAQGNIWKIEEWNANNAQGTSWTNSETFATKPNVGNDVLMRPGSVRNPGAIPFFWVDAEAFDAYNDWEGASVKWPSPS